MEIEGKVVQVLSANQGTSARGEWKRQDFVIETLDQYPKKVYISNWNNKVDLDNLKTGEQVKVSINIESREYYNKWYTYVKAWKLEKSGENTASNGENFSATIPNDMPPPPEDELGEDDLPF